MTANHPTHAGKFYLTKPVFFIGFMGVGKTSVSLSREALGLPADADMKLYTFLASHTNKTGEEETVTGELVTVDGVVYVRFELNGLSRIYLTAHISV